MDSLQAIVLALIQGLTEFLPISSSGHLILVPALLGWPDQGLSFDVAVHFGSLIAVVTYFRNDLWAMAKSLFLFGSAESRMAWQIILATIPLGLAGLFLADFVETELRSPLVIAAASAGFGVLLWVVDLRRKETKSERSLSWADALLIGIGQALALIPGTSRSGITMTVGLSLGLDRVAAGRFSFLLAVPAIGMAATWQLIQLGSNPESVNWGMLGLATLISAITAFLAIAFFLRLIAKVGMGAFAIYRIVLAGVIVYVFS